MMYNKSRLLTLLFLSATILFISCNKKSKKTENTQPIQTYTTNAPVFNSDSAYAYVAAQVAFGPRVPNTSAHVKCGDYIIGQLKKYGWEVTVQSFQATSFDNKQLNARNIIASYNPKSTKRIMIASHWDSRPFADQDSKDQNSPIDGANDGGSGVGIMIELARAMQNASQKPNVGMDLVFFDVEDYGQPEFSPLAQKSDSWCLGSPLCRKFSKA